MASDSDPDKRGNRTTMAEETKEKDEPQAADDSASAEAEQPPLPEIDEAESEKRLENLQRAVGNLLRTVNEYRRSKDESRRAKLREMVREFHAHARRLYEHYTEEGDEKLHAKHTADALWYMQKGRAGYEAVYPEAEGESASEAVLESEAAEA